MEDPWQILILDRNTASEKDVKSAYARLLKQHRPGSDPEGFRRVREAYEAALDWLRNRADQTQADLFYGDDFQENGESESAATPFGDLPVVYTDFPLPEEAQTSLAEVEQAAESGDAEALAAALDAFEERCDAGDVSGETRAMALERAFHGKVNALATAASDEFLVKYAELGQWNMVHLMVSAWQESGERERLVQFSRKLLKLAGMLTSPDGAMSLARVGMLTGLEQPEVAGTLANAAYPNLPVGARNHVMAQLEQEAAMGRIFADVTLEKKPFWFDRLRQGDSGYDWSSAEAQQALNDVIQRNRYMWQGWGVVKQMIPDELWTQVESRLQNQAQQVAQSTPKASRFPGWLILPVVLIVINLTRFLGNETRTPTVKPLSDYYIPAPQLSTPDSERGLKLYREFKEKQKQKEAVGTRTVKSLEELMAPPTPAPAAPPAAPPPSPQELEEKEREAAAKRARDIKNGTFMNPTLPHVELR